MNTSFIPIVSIVIPTYNHAKFIGKALESVIDQTYKNWEAIVIDNNSTDDTDKVINQYNDPRIKYLKINNDGVIAKSRNQGIREAKGEWIAFLDSDDWWTKDKLEVCLSETDKNDFLFTYPDNGIGLDDEKDSKKTMGQRLIKMLAEEIEADLVIKNEKGLAYSFNFKIKNR